MLRQLVNTRDFAIWTRWKEDSGLNQSTQRKHPTNKEETTKSIAYNLTFKSHDPLLGIWPWKRIQTQHGNIFAIWESIYHCTYQIYRGRPSDSTAKRKEGTHLLSAWYLLLISSPKVYYAKVAEDKRTKLQAEVASSTNGSKQEDAAPPAEEEAPVAPSAEGEDS